MTSQDRNQDLMLALCGFPQQVGTSVLSVTLKVLVGKPIAARLCG